MKSSYLSGYYQVVLKSGMTKKKIGKEKTKHTKMTCIPKVKYALGSLMKELMSH